MKKNMATTSDYNETVAEALDELFKDALNGEAVQTFAKNHPGQKMEISASVTVQVVGKPECAVVGQYGGYVLQAAK